MNRLILPVILAAMTLLAPRARAAGAGCTDTSGPLVLELVKSNAVGQQIFGCINRSLSRLSTGTVVSSTYSVASIGWLHTPRISGIATGVPGIRLSSSAYLDAGTYLHAGGSVTIAGGGGLGVTYGLTAASGTFVTIAAPTILSSATIKGGGGLGVDYGLRASTGTITSWLSVGGSITIGSSVTAAGALLTSTLTVTGSGVGAWPNNSGTAQSSGQIARFYNGVDAAALDVGLNGNYIWLQSSARINLANPLTLLLNPNGGTVGIGTNNPPGSTLHVGGTLTAGASAAQLNFNTQSNLYLPYGLEVTTITAAGTTITSTGTWTPHFYAASSGTWVRHGLVASTGTFHQSVTTPRVIVNETDSTTIAVDIQGSSTRGALWLNNNGVATVQVSGGTEDNYFNGGGNFGVNTASPNAELEVKSSAVGSSAVRVEAADGSAAVTLNEESSGAGSVYIYNNDETAHSRISSDQTSYIVGGNVGIGTVSPAAPLEVSGASSEITLSSGTGTGQRYGSLTYGVGLSNGFDIYGRAGKSLGLGANGTVHGIIDTSGRFGLGLLNPGAKVDALGVVRVSSSAYSAPTYGQGLELHFVNDTLALSPTAAIFSYDRSGSAYMPMMFGASVYKFTNASAIFDASIKLLGGAEIAGNITTYGSNGNGASDGILISTASNVGVTQRWIIDNQDNTNGASHASVLVQTGGSSGGDPFVQFNNRTQNWAMGMDNSDNDYFKLSYNTTLGTNDALVVGDSLVRALGSAASQFNLSARAPSGQVALFTLEADSANQLNDYAYFRKLDGSDLEISVTAVGVGGLKVSTDGVVGVPYGMWAATGTFHTGITVGSAGNLVGTLASGEYTAVMSTQTNLDLAGGAVANSWRYTRIGNQVQVAGQVEVDATAAADADTEAFITLPVASDFDASADLSGQCTGFGAPNRSIQVSGSVSKDQASLTWRAEVTGSVLYACQFMYEVK